MSSSDCRALPARGKARCSNASIAPISPPEEASGMFRDAWGSSTSSISPMVGSLSCATRRSASSRSSCGSSPVLRRSISWPNRSESVSASTRRRRVRGRTPFSTASESRAACSPAYPATFSGGEQQRVNIARAVGWNPSFLLLDEPTASLDAGSIERVLELFAQLRNEGSTFLGVFHDPRLLERIADRVVHIEGASP